MKILIVGPSWVGDMVMAQTLFQCLQQRHPGCAIDVLAPEWSRPILERMPEVRQALSFPLGHGVLELATRRKIGKSLAGQYDQAILLPNSLKSALVPFFAGVPKRTGWKGELRYGLLNDIRTLDKERYPLMIERFMALAFEPGASLPDNLAREVLQSLFSRINILRATSLMHPARIDESLAEIDALAAALEKRDAEEAARIASLHVQNACVVALQLLKEQRDEAAAEA